MRTRLAVLQHLRTPIDHVDVVGHNGGERYRGERIDKHGDWIRAARAQSTLAALVVAKTMRLRRVRVVQPYRCYVVLAR